MTISSLLYKLLGAGTDDAAQAELVKLTGIVVATAWDGTDQPGWLYCDGSAVSRSTYAALFHVIGEAFGEGDGSTTFNLPDLEGRFVRGVDNGAGRDPDAASRTAMATGGNTGDALGAVQADALQGHLHTVYPFDGGGSGTGKIRPQDSPSSANAAYAQDTIATLKTDGSNGTPRTSSETRPVNAGLRYYIKT